MYTVVWVLYRWHGTSREQFRKHYDEVHSTFGRALPGARKYTLHFNQDDPLAGADGPPRPDAFAVVQWNSEADFLDATTSKAFADAYADAEGFIGRIDNYVVEEVPYLEQQQ